MTRSQVFKLLMSPQSVPAGIVGVAGLIICMPSKFPHHGQPNKAQRVSMESFKRVDFPGVGLLLAATVLLVAALEEAGTLYPWKSAYVITLLTISGLLWIVFLLWERKVTLAENIREPVFPWRFLQSRVWIGMLMYVWHSKSIFKVLINSYNQKCILPRCSILRHNLSDSTKIPDCQWSFSPDSRRSPSCFFSCFSNRLNSNFGHRRKGKGPAHLPCFIGIGSSSHRIWIAVKYPYYFAYFACSVWL